MINVLRYDRVAKVPIPQRHIDFPHSQIFQLPTALPTLAHLPVSRFLVVPSVGCVRVHCCRLLDGLRTSQWLQHFLLAVHSVLDSARSNPLSNGLDGRPEDSDEAHMTISHHVLLLD
jgi:hypothetical protein